MMPETYLRKVIRKFRGNFMKNVFLIFLAISFFLATSSCELFQRPAVLKTIKVDGDLTDWEDYLFNDPSSDTKKNDGSNEIYQLGILTDATNLYISAKIKINPLTNFVLLVDISGIKGVKDVSTVLKNYDYKYEYGDVDLVFWWNTGIWKVYKLLGETESASATATEIKSVTFSQAIIADKIQLEFSIPLSQIGVTDPSKLNSKCVAFIHDLLPNNNSYFVSDFCPNQGQFENDTGFYKIPITVYYTISNPKR